jgi:thiosulfate dehydrogenase [quinone] large subunit
VREVVLPNFRFFGWAVLFTEAALGAFLLLGLATRFWAVVGLVQSLFITLAVLNTPGEWEWSYYLMMAGHLGVFALAAGRVGGLDGLLRPVWARSGTPVARTLLRAS